MTKKEDAAKPGPAPAATPDSTAAAAQGAEIRLSAAPAVPPAPAPVPQVQPEVRSLDDVDWEQVNGPTAVAQPPELRSTMGHDFDTHILVDTMTAWKEKAKFDTLQYVAGHPITTLGVLILSPCQKGDEGWTPVRPDGGSAHVQLRDALKEFALTWPKDENISFPGLIKKTKWGWSLILDVANRKYVAINHRSGDAKKGKETKP